MSYDPLPIDHQLADSSGDPYSGAIVKAYLAGTTTTTPLYTDYTGAVSIPDATLNASGYPEASSNVITIHGDTNVGRLKVALYPDRAAADSDSGAIWSIDNLALTSLSSSVASNLAALKAYTNMTNNDVVNVLGHTINGDGGGGLFRWDDSLTTADDDGVYLQPDLGGTGRWVRILDGDFVTPQMFGANADGLTDDSPAINAAIASTKLVYMPSGTYQIDSPIILDYDKARGIYGDDWQSTMIRSSTSDIIYAGGVNDVSGGLIEGVHLYSEIGGRHNWQVKYDLTNYKIRRCKFTNLNLDKSLVKKDQYYSGHVLIENCIFTAALGVLTAYPIDVYSDEIANGWVIKDCWWNNSDTLQFCRVGSSNTSSYCTNILIENITCEQTNGGMVRLESCRSATLDNISSYDLNATQNGHGIYVGANGNSLISSRIKIRHCMKQPIAGYALGSGITDIYLNAGEAANCLIEACTNAQSGNAFTVDYGSNKVLHIDPPAESTEANYSNNANVRYVDVNGDWEGLVFPAYRTNISPGTLWTSGTNSPEGNQTAPSGSMYSRESPGNYQALYTKLSASGNTGWNVCLSLPLFDTTALEDVAATVNTSAEKVDGYIVFNTTTGLPVVAGGNADADVWKALSGSTAHTPV